MKRINYCTDWKVLGLTTKARFYWMKLLYLSILFPFRGNEFIIIIVPHFDTSSIAWKFDSFKICVCFHFELLIREKSIFCRGHFCSQRNSFNLSVALQAEWTWALSWWKGNVAPLIARNAFSTVKICKNVAYTFIWDGNDVNTHFHFT